MRWAQLRRDLRHGIVADAVVFDIAEALLDHRFHVLAQHGDGEGQEGRERVPVEAADETAVEGLRREGAEELDRTLERGDGVDEEAGGQAAQLVVEGFDGRAGCRGPVAAAVDVGFRAGRCLGMRGLV